MSLLNQARIIIYRCHEKGLEVFLLNPTDKTDKGLWKFPDGSIDPDKIECIHLEPTTDENGDSIPTVAISGDWHDIPSIRGLIKYDIRRVKSKVKQVLPCLETGDFVDVKSVFKKVMPHEYQSLKELRDIVTDRNTILNI